MERNMLECDIELQGMSSVAEKLDVINGLSTMCGWSACIRFTYAAAVGP